MEGSVTNLGGTPFGYMWECPDRIALDGREYLGTCPQGMAMASDPDDPSKLTCQNVHAAGYFPMEGTILDVMHQDTGLMGADAPHAAIDASTFHDWDHGFDYYACQTLVDERGRTLLIGWMSLPHDANDVRPYDNPTTTWKGCLTVPRELTRDARTGLILQHPVKEFDDLRRSSQEMGHTATGFATELCPKVADVVVSGIRGDLAMTFGDFLTLTVADGIATLGFARTDAGTTAGQGRAIRRAAVDGIRDLRVIVDTSVLEIYLNDGAAVFSTRYFTEDETLPLAIHTTAEQATVYGMEPLSICLLYTSDAADEL